MGLLDTDVVVAVTALVARGVRNGFRSNLPAEAPARVPENTPAVAAVRGRRALFLKGGAPALRAWRVARSVGWVPLMGTASGVRPATTGLHNTQAKQGLSIENVTLVLGTI